MSKYSFDPKALIGFLRIARPGSVIGIQQDFLYNSVTKMKMFTLKKSDSGALGNNFTFVKTQGSIENLG
jgi:hypothetical protein